MKTMLKNAKIYDGTGAPAFTGDILLENHKILQVGQHLDAEADRVMDLQGLSVAPGFIDAHSHNDWFAHRKENLPYFEPFLRQGITTFVCGNCGLSAVGYHGDSPHKDRLGAGLFFLKDLKKELPKVGEYLRFVDGNMPCNLAVLAGHCTARASVAGSSSEALNEQQLEQMLSLLEEALQQGAAGISLGLMYDPGIYAGKEELRRVAELCEKYDRPLTVHPRANSAVSMAYPELLGRSHLLRAVDELVEMVKGLKVKLHYSHAIFVGRRSFKDKAEFVSIMESLRAEGVDAMFDIYDEKLGVSVITVILPVWYQAMSAAERKKLINRIKLSVLVRASSLLLGFGFRDIQVAYIGPGYERYEGKTVHEIAKEEKLSDLKAYLMLCEKSDFKGRVNMGPYTTDEILDDFRKKAHCLYMTDAWVEEHGIQNPAIYDCFPKFLQASLQGRGDSMAQTVRRMTGATADRFGLADRGYIRPGAFGDLTVFDEEELKTAKADQEKSFGIRKVFINGHLVLEEGQLHKTLLQTSGRAIGVK